MTVAERDTEAQEQKRRKQGLRSRYVQFLNTIASKPVKIRITEDEYSQGHSSKITPIPLITEKKPGGS